MNSTLDSTPTVAFISIQVPSGMWLAHPTTLTMGTFGFDKSLSRCCARIPAGIQNTRRANSPKAVRPFMEPLYLIGCGFAFSFFVYHVVPKFRYSPLSTAISVVTRQEEGDVR